MALLSIRGYARHRGVSHTTVMKAIRAGRITLDKNGRIDPKAADRQWSSSTDLSRSSNTVTGTPRRRRDPTGPPPPVPGLEGAGAGANGHQDPEAQRLISSWAAARAASEHLTVRLKRLELEQKLGKLVDADVVKAQIFALGRRMRDVIMGVPDRIAPMLAEMDQATVHRVLQEELRRALEDLAAAPPIKPKEKK